MTNNKLHASHKSRIFPYASNTILVKDYTSLPQEGEECTGYLVMETGKRYIWDGSVYLEIIEPNWDLRMLYPIGW